MTRNGVTNDQMVQFRNFIVFHQYDTESLFDDVESMDISSTNVLCNICSSGLRLFATTLYDYIHFMKSM